MNIEERDRILMILDNIEKFNFSDEVTRYYKDSPEINSIAIGRYPVKEFIGFFNRAIKQMKLELQTDNYFFYPLTPHAQPIAGINIEAVLNQILNSLINGVIPEIEKWLDQLITFEIYIGVWHLSSHRIHSTKGLEIEKKSVEIDLQKKDLELLISACKANINELQNAKSQLDEFLAVKQQELTLIANNKTQSSTDSQQIAKLLQDSQKLNSDLNAMVAVQNEKLKEIKEEYDSAHFSFSEFETYYKETEKKIKDLIEAIDSKLSTSDEKLKYIESKREEIVKLVGLAADGSLGYKFDERKTHLGKGLNFWKGMVPGITVLSIIWVVIVFTCLSADTGVYWQNLVINVFKTFPVFILMGFVFRQYNRERNLQEEYAFKAAVAMTITSYSDMLKDQDTAQNKTRQEMLIKAIIEVYNSSKLQPEVKQRLLSFSTKDLKETVAQLTEALGQMKNISK